ncbi:phenylalanine--tRNA ligase subunit alpha [Thermoleophilia bacterium SCSIO 60948]|nr:phenylalanine--tRNA ligase subunit alpha [Thermoleophilia bacterium SCSIO 60948]
MAVEQRIAEIQSDGREAIAAAASTAELEDLRVSLLGRSAELTGILRGIGELDPAERGAVGKAGNVARKSLESELAARREELAAAELDAELAADPLDVTLPGSPPAPIGWLHLVTRTRREIEDVFCGLGYRVAEGPEIEHDFYNFTALNHPPGHPARMLADTFYVDPESVTAERWDPAGEGARHELRPTLPPGPRDLVLRTHTSPMQVRSMEAADPPLYLIVPGATYRRDNDATHTPMFNQIEGIVVDEGITLADLQGTLLAFARAIFGPDRDVRLRPHFFPFTEPSVEVDVSCFVCGGTGEVDGARDSLCKGTGWIEILGSGMIDPNVFGFVGREAYDPERVQGFAFGMGIERIAMLKHAVPDLRLFYEGDVRFGGQFR